MCLCSEAQAIKDLNVSYQEIPVTILGTFHFSYPNLDRIKTEKDKQVDMLSPQRQEEIQELIEKLKKFKPTIIAVECPVEMQARMDSLYTAYCKGSFDLPVGEQYQVGFRLAKESGIERVCCIDTWGDYERFMDKEAFFSAYERYLDSNRCIYCDQQLIALNENIHAMNLVDFYIETNSAAALKKMQSNYFLSNFLFEGDGKQYSGVDWITAQWYNRNLRIIRNLMRIKIHEGDRILIIYGNGHHALLRDYIDYNPFYRYVSVIDYLR
ncbi:MAG TPA: hypothetical protein DCR43_06955 [Bacteroidales bacterium]|nr:MAG: hypothetical protein A2X11_16425 [Bacteroidetes bacterium GWE2_42_24]OFY26364.1 MAG: hypothetical protein A2X09_00265 [Bacteroidetes bacterium GWF2_43_11]PKP27892.1 MAG: hypothetical protein CVU06_00705 [Bacteroidetes bacterium HGW-Bacteroidetes-22]HAQ65573.1 hypothetical protein [Bacteroidales bacterium]HBZ66876.1 hypothetical protein [Bacteroidales bacterium]